MPKIKKIFTDLDREQFLRESFKTIAAYFQNGLKQLEQTGAGIVTDFDEIQRFKFVAKIFTHGQGKARCKVWRGGVSDKAIAYSENFQNYDEDNSFNEQISIESSETELGLKFLMGLRWGFAGNDKKILPPAKAAEELWKRFIQRVE